MPCERSHCTATLEPVAEFKVNGTQPGLCIAYEQWKLQPRSVIRPRRAIPVSEKSQKSTWWLIQYAKIVAVSPSLNASKDHDHDPQWLGVLQARLRASRLHGFWDNTFLYAPEYKLTLTFDEGSQRTILFGAAPPNVIRACRVLIDGQERVVMSPGLPEYDRMISRCQKVDPQADQQTARSASTFPLGTFGILMSLIIYLLYVALR